MANALIILLGRKPKGIKFNLKKMIKYADDRDYLRKI